MMSITVKIYNDDDDDDDEDEDDDDDDCYKLEIREIAIISFSNSANLFSG